LKVHNDNGPYPIPSVFYPKVSKIMIGLLVFLDLDILFLVFTFRSLENVKGIQFETSDLITFTGFFLFLVLAHYFVFFRQFLRKEYIELNETSIKVKLIFKKEKVYDWEKVKYAGVFIGPKGWRFIKIVGIEPIDQLFSKTTSIKIPLEIKFANIAEDRFLHTIDKMKTMQSINKT
jgi:hypothetical protein